MNSYCCVVFSVLAVTVMSQRYKKIYIKTNNGTQQKQNLWPESNQVIYEMRSCDFSSLKFKKKYTIQKNARNGKLLIAFTKSITEKAFAQRTIENWSNCQEFHHFKFGSINGNLTLWTFKRTGWDVLLTSEDPFHGERFSDVTVFSLHADWKIHQIEHTTQPYKEMCINF